MFRVLCLKWSVQKNCVAKTLQRIWKTFFYESNRKYNSYKFCYRLAFFSLFLAFPKTRIKLSASWWSENEKYSCILLTASLNLLQRYDEYSRPLWKDYSARIIVLCNEAASQLKLPISCSKKYNFLLLKRSIRRL